MNMTMIEPARVDRCNALPRAIGCDAWGYLRLDNTVKRRDVVIRSAEIIASCRKYELEDGVVNWDILHDNFQLLCLTH